MGNGGNGSGMPGAGGLGGGQELSGGGLPGNPSNQPHATEYTLQGIFDSSDLYFRFLSANLHALDE